MFSGIERLASILKVLGTIPYWISVDFLSFSQKRTSQNDILSSLVCVTVFFQVWINQGDIILVGLRDYQDAKADVILRYNPDEARNLKTYGELPETGNVVSLFK